MIVGTDAAARVVRGHPVAGKAKQGRTARPCNPFRFEKKVRIQPRWGDSHTSRSQPATPWHLSSHSSPRTGPTRPCQCPAHYSVSSAVPCSHSLLARIEQHGRTSVVSMSQAPDARWTLRPSQAPTAQLRDTPKLTIPATGREPTKPFLSCRGWVGAVDAETLERSKTLKNKQQTECRAEREGTTS